jgi:hypothetical protein
LGKEAEGEQKRSFHEWTRPEGSEPAMRERSSFTRAAYLPYFREGANTSSYGSISLFP